MKQLTRRSLLKAAVAAITGAAWCAFSCRSEAYFLCESVEVERARTFAAPFLKNALLTGRPLSIVKRRDKLCVCLDDRIVGWLPKSIVDDQHRLGSRGWPARVTVDRTTTDCNGRLRLFVTLTLAA